MFQRRQRRFGRNRTSDRRHQSRINNNDQSRARPHSFQNGHSRNQFRSTQSAEKLLEKYKTLAKEALSFGDKTLHENYLQHADHFTRIIDDRNRNQKLHQTKNNSVDKAEIIENTSTELDSLNQNQTTEEKEKI